MLHIDGRVVRIEIPQQNMVSGEHV
jgi:hypothetical protein